MKAITYYIALPFVRLVALLPFPVLYTLSDALCFVLKGVIGYRKHVIHENLQRSFPNKSDDELKRIGSAYYRHMCDVILETFKVPGMSKDELTKRCAITNMETANKLLQKYGHLIVALGHQGNWEWMGSAAALRANFPLLVIYRQLSNPHFDRLMVRTRSRFGAVPVRDKDLLRQLLRRANEPSAVAFIADQTPPPEYAAWLTFLNQDTPVYNGTEKIARRLNAPVVFAAMKKIKRGHYIVNVEVLCEQPTLLSDGELTELHTRALERSIVQQPETWLWSHRRWKHKRTIV